MMLAGTNVASHHRSEEEMIYVYEGTLVVEWPEGSVTMGRGDVLTIPKQLNRLFRSSGGDTAIAYVIRGGDKPAAPQWIR